MDCDYVCKKEATKQTSFKKFVTVKRSNKDILDDNTLLPLFLSHTYNLSPKIKKNWKILLNIKDKLYRTCTCNIRHSYVHVFLAYFCCLNWFYEVERKNTRQFVSTKFNAKTKKQKQLKCLKSSRQTITCNIIIKYKLTQLILS